MYQIPSKPRKNGRTKTKIHGRQNDLKKERNAEIIPLFNAVKKEEEKNDLLVQQQTLEMQTEIEIGKQEELNEINAETAPEGGSGGKGAKSKSTGSKENGTYNNPAYDRWGNRKSADGKVNKWDKWDKNHV